MNRDDQEDRGSTRLCTFPDVNSPEINTGPAVQDSSTSDSGLSKLEGIRDSELATQEALARLDLSRAEGQGMSPSPSPSYDHGKGSGATPSVTSLSDGEEEQSAVLRDGHSSKGKAAMTVDRSNHPSHRRLTRDTSTDSAFEEEEEETPIPSPDPEDTLRPSSTFSSGMIDPEPDMGGVSKTVLEKAWGPAPVKRRTTSWLGPSPVATAAGGETPGDEGVGKVGSVDGAMESVEVDEVEVEQVEEEEE